MTTRLLTQSAAGLILVFTVLNTPAQTTAPPPALGQETKGEPAPEALSTETPTKSEIETTAEAEQDTAEEAATVNPFGTTTIKESRRENGQLYLIELEHSSGRKQYIEETDSDGSIEGEQTKIEDTPNLPKWRLGSW